MACTAYGSSSEVSLWYAVDSDPAADVPAAQVWMPIPMTGESLDASLTSTISDQITPKRSYADSKLSQGEISGSFSFEASAGAFVQNMLIAALQAPKTMSVPATPGNWVDGAAIQNESTKHCLMFLKKVNVGSGSDLYLFRGCQISSMSMSMEPGNLITGDISIMGTGLGEPVSGIRVYEAIAENAAPLGVGGWDLSNSSFGMDDVMSGVDSLQSFDVKNSGGTSLGIVTQSLSLTIDNQLRQQFAVGTNNIFAAGVASGRFMASMSLSAYYQNPTIFDAFTSDENLSVTFNLKDKPFSGGSEDVAAQGFEFEFNKCKVTSGSSPLAGGPDQDLLISTEIRAFEHPTDGTVKVTLDTAVV